MTKTPVLVAATFPIERSCLIFWVTSINIPYVRSIWATYETSEIWSLWRRETKWWLMVGGVWGRLCLLSSVTNPSPVTNPISSVLVQDGWKPSVSQALNSTWLSFRPLKINKWTHFGGRGIWGNGICCFTIPVLRTWAGDAAGPGEPAWEMWDKPLDIQTCPIVKLVHKSLDQSIPGFRRFRFCKLKMDKEMEVMSKSSYTPENQDEPWKWWFWIGISLSRCRFFRGVSC